MDDLTVRATGDEDAGFVRADLESAFASSVVAVCGELVVAAALPGRLALVNGERAGVLTYRPGDDWEVLSVVATRRAAGVGEALMRAVT